MNTLTKIICGLISLFAFACGSAVKPVANHDYNYSVVKLEAKRDGDIVVFYKAPKAEEKTVKAPIVGETVIEIPATETTASSAALICTMQIAGYEEAGTFTSQDEMTAKARELGLTREVVTSDGKGYGIAVDYDVVYDVNCEAQLFASN